MAVSAAERRALSRRRAARGDVVLQIVTNRCDLVCLLEEAELLDPMVEETPAVLAKAVQELLKLLRAARDYMAAHDVQ